MVINHVQREFNVNVQTEMFELIKHLANCEPFEVDGLKARANILIEILKRGKGLWKEPMDVLIVFLGIWWLAFMPCIFLFAAFDVIKEWIDEKVRELRRRS